MILFHCCAPLQSPRTHTCEYLGSFQILGVRKWVDVFQYKSVKCPSLVLVPRGGCLSLGRTAPYTLSHCVGPGAVRFPEVWHENCSLFAFSDCSGAVNKEIDDKVVERRQLGRTAPRE